MAVQKKNGMWSLSFSLVVPKDRFPVVFIAFLGLVAVMFSLAAHFSSVLDPKTSSPYAVVTMTTGETYFGRFSTWPRFKLTDPFILQRTVDPISHAEQISVPALVQAFWQPDNVLILNPREIVSWSYLRSDSRLIPYLEHPGQMVSAQEMPNVSQGRTPMEPTSPQVPM